jgi:hypothetical protein
MDPLPNLKFVFARTMPEVPHEYVVRKPWNDAEYCALFKAIEEHGIWEMWKTKKRKYWYRGDGWKYWRMTTVLKLSRVINRQRVKETVTSHPAKPPRRKN